MIIKELKINSEYDGVVAISLVSDPAIEENFRFFNKEIKMGRGSRKTGGEVYYQYTTVGSEPQLVDDSHPFCREHAGRIFTETEIRSWAKYKGDSGFIKDSNFFNNFPNEGFSLNMGIHNCRHKLIKVRSFQDERNDQKFNAEYKFNITNSDKKEIEGTVLLSGKMIYRNNVENNTDGYVYFSRQTIRDLFKKYGKNRSATLQHQYDITGYLICLNSWLEEDDEKNITKWKMKYKVLNDELWNAIKNNIISGFSVEVFI